MREQDISNLIDKVLIYYPATFNSFEYPDPIEGRLENWYNSIKEIEWRI